MLTGQVWSGANKGQAETNPEAAPASQPRKEQTLPEEGEDVEAVGRKGQPLPSDAAAAEVLQSTPSQPSLSSSAADTSGEDKIRSGPSSNGVTAEEAARDAVFLEYLPPSAPSFPIVQREGGREEPEDSSARGWQYAAALSLLALEVFALWQPRSRNRTAAESDSRTD
jgi:hypothetical protein